MDASPLVWIVLGALLAERVVELAIDRRNARWLATNGARWHAPDGFALIVGSQVALFGATLAECLFAPWARPGWWTWPLLAVALGAQALRYWVIRTLGARWSVRVATLAGAPRIDAGPYRWLRHPNYVAVAAEAVVVPLALGAFWSALVVGTWVLVALWRRVGVEERALASSA